MSTDTGLTLVTTPRTAETFPGATWGDDPTPVVDLGCAGEWLVAFGHIPEAQMLAAYRAHETENAGLTPEDMQQAVECVEVVQSYATEHHYDDADEDDGWVWRLTACEGDEGAFPVTYVDQSALI